MKRAAAETAGKALEPLPGTGRTAAGPLGDPPWPGEGRSTFEWVEGSSFMLQRKSGGDPKAPDHVTRGGAGG